MNDDLLVGLIYNFMLGYLVGVAMLVIGIIGYSCWRKFK